MIDNGFFSSPKSSKEIHEEMNREGYYKSLQNIDGALRKTFVKKKILERIKGEDKVWKYALRK